MTVCERYRVSGRVQGVGFRAAAAATARRLGVRGWVRNLPDGRVEAVAGADAKALAQFAAWLREGPPAARVTGLEQLRESGENLPAGFEIR